MAVAEQLDFDVAWPVDVAFEIDAAVLENALSASRLAACKPVVSDGRAHAAAAAARRRLDQNREADGAGEPAFSSSVVINPSLPGTTGTPALTASLRGLVAEQVMA